MMKTSVSGLAAQASRLSTVGDNIANSDTVGYKKSSVEFSTFVLHQHNGSYASGAVGQHVRQGVTDQGVLQFTASPTDIAVSGQGFFLVQDGAEQPLLTRAGSFVTNAEGELINAAGFKLLGYADDLFDDGAIVNGTAGLEVVNVGDFSLQANPSREGQLSFNLPADAIEVAAADLPSANLATSTPSAKSSAIGYDYLGREVSFDIYFSKTASEEWEMTVFESGESVAANGTLPYATGPLVTETLLFDATTGRLDGASPTEINIPVPNGELLVVDVSASVQLATGFSVSKIEVDGNGAAAVDRVEFSEEGSLYAVYTNGQRIPQFRVPLATVASPDQLRSESGNVFQVSARSGDLSVGLAGSAGFGTIQSGTLESSTVDLAGELTTMIQAQRSYTANSKVFQTGSELLDVLVNLKR